jgi:hypothetical protein
MGSPAPRRVAQWPPQELQLGEEHDEQLFSDEERTVPSVLPKLHAEISLRTSVFLHLGQAIC